MIAQGVRGAGHLRQRRAEHIDRLRGPALLMTDDGKQVPGVEVAGLRGKQRAAHRFGLGEPALLLGDSGLVQRLGNVHALTG